MLSEEQIASVKNTYLNLVRTIDIPGADIEGLIKYLESTDFFTAPATTQYHCAFPGGLCLHSLQVYNTLESLVKTHCTKEEEIDGSIVSKRMYDENTTLILGLFHDLSKINYFEKYCKNEKVYSEMGTKKDSIGSFDWMSTEAYKIKEGKDRYTCGSSAFNTYMILSRYIPLTDEQITALVNANYGMDNGYMDKDFYTILNKNSLVTLLHCADVLSSFVLEK